MSNTQNIPMTAAREWRRYGCATYSAAPDLQTATPTEDTTGVYQLTEALDPLLGAHTGVNPTVLVAPVSPNGSAWDLRVYGAKPVRLAAGTIGGWLWVTLYKGSVTPLGAGVGTPVSGAVASGERLTASVATDIGNDGVDCQPTDTAASEGPATLRIDTRGCPFLWFQGAASTAVLVSRQ